jgi:hypothetical protein
VLTGAATITSKNMSAMAQHYSTARERMTFWDGSLNSAHFPCVPKYYLNCWDLEGSHFPTSNEITAAAALLTAKTNKSEKCIDHASVGLS